MPAERVSMRQAREIIRLKFSAGIPTREIARRLGVAASTVRETLRRFEGAGLGWPLPDGMSDGDLEAALYANHGTKRGHRRHAEPDWPTVHRELKRKHVTLVIVWDEYIAANPGGYSYSRFCELYRGFESKLSPTMRQTHAAGERLFVDYAGDGVPVVIDRLTGEIRKAQIFVAVLGASSFTFAHASWTQALPDWIDAHVRALEVIGGVPHLLVPDNTKTAVIKACLYDPQVNRTYAEMAAHYDAAILPARPRRPRDKAKVEQAVLIVERWLLGRLRHRTFYSLAEVNAAIGELMTHLNEERPTNDRCCIHPPRHDPPHAQATCCKCLAMNPNFPDGLLGSKLTIDECVIRRVIIAYAKDSGLAGRGEPVGYHRRGLWYSAHFRHGAWLCVAHTFGAGIGARRPVCRALRHSQACGSAKRCGAARARQDCQIGNLGRPPRCAH